MALEPVVLPAPRSRRSPQAIQAGMLWINQPAAPWAEMPFGGVKSSGYGRFGGKAAIDAFTELRWITIEDPGQHYPF